MKRGFTLVELLAVIAILGVIGLITVPVVTKVIQDNKNNIKENQEKLIEAAAKNYNVNNVFKDNKDRTVDVRKLIEEGYLDDIEEDYIDGCVKITYSNSKYSYEYKSDCS